MILFCGQILDSEVLVSIYASPGVLHAAPPSVGGEGVVGLVGEGGAVPAVQYSTGQYSTA